MSRQDKIREAAQGYIDRRQFSGIEWYVEAKGKKLDAGQVGAADGAAPIPEQAIYRIYSMTKPIVSVMALILVEQGGMRLYDMLAQFNPAFRNMRVLLTEGSLQPAVRPIVIEDHDWSHCWLQ